MRRLLFVGGTSDPGGLHIHTADVAQAAAALGHSVAIVSGEVDLFSNLFPRDRIPFAVDERLSWSRLRRRRLKHLAIRTVAWLSILSRYRGYDLVLCRGAFAETPAVELLMARALGRNIYTIEHSQWLNEWPFKASKRRYGSIMNACVRRVVAVSGEIADAAIAEFGVSAGKIRICFNWPDPMFLPADTERRRQARSRLGVGADATVIGFVGRHGPEKRVEVLMEAFHRHIRPRYPGAVLVVAGDGWYRRKLERQAALCGVEADIRFVGWRADPREIFDALDVFVLPSLMEGFPVALMEAMASGVACLAHPMSSTRALIEDGRSGVVADLSTVDLLGEALGRMLAAGRRCWWQMGDAAASTIQRAFSRETRLRAVLEALDIDPGAALPSPYGRMLEYHR